MHQQQASYYHAFTEIEEQDCRLTVPVSHMPTPSVRCDFLDSEAIISIPSWEGDFCITRHIFNLDRCPMLADWFTQLYNEFVLGGGWEAVQEAKNCTSNGQAKEEKDCASNRQAKVSTFAFDPIEESSGIVSIPINISRKGRFYVKLQP